MRNTMILAASFLLFSAIAAPGQNPAAPYTNQVSDQAVLAELRNISRSVASLVEGVKASVEREPVRPGGLTEKQQKMVLSMDMLVRSEERVANFQRLQVDLVERLNENRTKLAQVEVDLRPLSIDRSVQFEGTTQTEELRDSKRTRLRAERTTLVSLITQIQSTLNETQESLNDALAQTFRLRRAVLPQIERELLDQ